MSACARAYGGRIGVLKNSNPSRDGAGALDGEKQRGGGYGRGSKSAATLDRRKRGRFYTAAFIIYAKGVSEMRPPVATASRSPGITAAAATTVVIV